jgi:CRISPR-associated protein Cas1
MKPLRPIVDTIIIEWVTLQRWRQADLVIDRQGVMRVHSQIVRVVVTKAMLPEHVIRNEINAYLE